MASSVKEHMDGLAGDEPPLPLGGDVMAHPGWRAGTSRAPAPDRMAAAPGMAAPGMIAAAPGTSAPPSVVVATVTVEGALPWAGHTHRLRLPSAATSYRWNSDVLGPQASNNTTGREGSSASSLPTATTVNRLAPSMKNSSRPSRRHLGPTPPEVEIRRLPGFPNICTYTSGAPDSSDT